MSTRYVQNDKLKLPCCLNKGNDKLPHINRLVLLKCSHFLRGERKREEGQNRKKLIFILNYFIVLQRSCPEVMDPCSLLVPEPAIKLLIIIMYMHHVTSLHYLVEAIQFLVIG